MRTGAAFAAIHARTLIAGLWVLLPLGDEALEDPDKELNGEVM